MNTGELIVWLLLAVGYSLFLSILYQRKVKYMCEVNCPFKGNCSSEGILCQSCANNNQKPNHYVPKTVPYIPYYPWWYVESPNYYVYCSSSGSSTTTSTTSSQ